MVIVHKLVSGLTKYIRTLFSIVSSLIPYTLYSILISLILYTFPSIPYADASILTKPANNLGLVGYWNFNEGTSTYAGDFSANNNAGVLTNMANPPTATSGWANGKFGGGLSFDGVNDYVNILSNTFERLPATSNTTVSFWVKRKSEPSGGDAGLVVAAYGLHLYGRWGIVAGAENNADGKVRTIVYASNVGAYRIAESTTVLSIGSWYHVTGVYDRTNQLVRIYVNGIQEGTNTFLNTDVLEMTDSKPDTIASNQAGSNTSYFDGQIDDVRIYNRALTASEVTALYKSGSARFASSQTLTQGTTLANGIVGYWTFDGKDTTNTTATDVSGQGNTGTFTNFTRATNATAGKLGQGLSFDGVNDVVVTNPIVIPARYTVSLWYKNAQTPSTSLIDQPFVWNSAAFDHGISFSWDHVDASFRQAWAQFDGVYQGLKYTTSLSANTWYLLTLTYDGTTARAYLNGVQEVSSNIVAATDEGSELISIGAGLGGTASFDDGTTDDVRIYNRALSANEVKQLYNLGSAKAQASSVTLQQGTTLANGIVGHWTFDGKDTTNTTATDLSGQGNTGTFSGFTRATNAKAGKLGQGMSFDGVNDYVRLVGLNIAAASDFTFCGWVNPTAWVGNNPGIWRDNTSSNGNSFNIFQSNTGRPWIRWNSAEILKPSSGYAVPLNQWTHICYTVRSSANANFYANGVLKHSATHTTATPAFTIYNLGYQSTIGERINGTYDDVRIYNRALSANEVNQLYLMGK